MWIARRRAAHASCSCAAKSVHARGRTHIIFRSFVSVKDTYKICVYLPWFDKNFRHQGNIFVKANFVGTYSSAAVLSVDLLPPFASVLDPNLWLNLSSDHQDCCCLDFRSSWSCVSGTNLQIQRKKKKGSRARYSFSNTTYLVVYGLMPISKWEISFSSKSYKNEAAI